MSPGLIPTPTHCPEDHGPTHARGMCQLHYGRLKTRYLHRKKTGAIPPYTTLADYLTHPEWTSQAPAPLITWRQYLTGRYNPREFLSEAEAITLCQLNLLRYISDDFPPPPLTHLSPEFLAVLEDQARA